MPQTSHTPDAAALIEHPAALAGPLPWRCRAYSDIRLCWGNLTEVPTNSTFAIEWATCIAPGLLGVALGLLSIRESPFAISRSHIPENDHLRLEQHLRPRLDPWFHGLRDAIGADSLGQCTISLRPGMRRAPPLRIEPLVPALHRHLASLPPDRLAELPEHRALITFVPDVDRGGLKRLGRPLPPPVEEAFTAWHSRHCALFEIIEDLILLLPLGRPSAHDIARLRRPYP